MKLTKRKGFNFFRSYYDVYNELSDKDKVAFIDALLDRQFLGIKPRGLTGMAKFAYISQINSIDSQIKGFEDKTGIVLTPCQPPPVGGSVGGGVPPCQQVEEKGKEKVEVKDNMFDFFWDTYDYKVGRPKAEKAWSRLTDDQRENVMEHLKVYIPSTPDKKFRKHPTTYLNNKSWEDEINENTDHLPRFI